MSARCFLLLHAEVHAADVHAADAIRDSFSAVACLHLRQDNRGLREDRGEGNPLRRVDVGPVRGEGVCDEFAPAAQVVDASFDGEPGHLFQAVHPIQIVPLLEADLERSGGHASDSHHTRGRTPAGGRAGHHNGVAEGLHEVHRLPLVIDPCGAVLEKHRKRLGARAALPGGSLHALEGGTDCVPCTAVCANRVISQHLPASACGSRNKGQHSEQNPPDGVESHRRPSPSASHDYTGPPAPFPVRIPLRCGVVKDGLLSPPSLRTSGCCLTAVPWGVRRAARSELPVS